MIRALAGSGVTILLTTQYLDEADQLAARIAVIDHGRKIAEGTSRELKVATGSGFLHVALADPAGSTRRRGCSKRGWVPASSAAPKARTLAIVARTPRDANAALGALIDAGIELADFSMGSPSLDEVFFSLTGEGASERSCTQHRIAGAQTVARPPAPSALSNALVFGWRAVLKFKHLPEQLFDLVMTPIMFTLLFTFVFGGALAGSPSDYLQFFLPGILVQTVVFNAVYSGMGLSTDLGKGLFDRFRSLPIWSLAPFAGLMVGDVLRHLIAAAIILTIGLLLGYRPEAGIARRACGVRTAHHHRLWHGLGFHRAWPAGAHADDGDDAGLQLPVSAGVRLEHHGRSATMPDWLRAFVEVNPVSLMTTAMRGLMGGGGTVAAGGLALVAPVALSMLLAPVTIWLYREAVVSPSETSAGDRSRVACQLPASPCGEPSYSMSFEFLMPCAAARPVASMGTVWSARAMDDERGHAERPQVWTEVGGGEGLGAVERGFEAGLHRDVTRTTRLLQWLTGGD